MPQPKIYEQLPLPMQFGGLNLGGRPGILAKNESPRMLNVFSEVNGVIRTRLSRSLLFGALSQTDVHSIGKLVAGGVIESTKSPATTAEVADVFRPWVNPNNIFSSDDVRAEVTELGIVGGVDGRSNFLDITNFSFSIPAGATPVGVEIHVEGQGEGVGVNTVQVGSVQLLKAGVPTGDIKQGSNPPLLEGTDEIIKIGGVVDLWGVPWIATDFNASNFGLRMFVSVFEAGFPRFL
ncbi:hypothetical protein LCGC14_2020570 [marine sediment metagenome]|uniref:Uncharacterized protein n=1 Tax=marine sediment metagenome TaxID=412755 RepID=A0A0F9FK73_9ZZZZ